MCVCVCVRACVCVCVWTGREGRGRRGLARGLKPPCGPPEPLSGTWADLEKEKRSGRGLRVRVLVCACACCVCVVLGASCGARVAGACTFGSVAFASGSARARSSSLPRPLLPPVPPPVPSPASRFLLLDCKRRSDHLAAEIPLRHLQRRSITLIRCPLAAVSHAVVPEACAHVDKDIHVSLQLLKV